MGVDEEVRFRLNVQLALPNYVTPRLRYVSVDIAPERRSASLRFIFTRPPSDSERDATTSEATKVIANQCGGYQIVEYPVAPTVSRLSHLRLIVYYCCENASESPDD